MIHVLKECRSWVRNWYEYLTISLKQFIQLFYKEIFNIKNLINQTFGQFKRVGVSLPNEGIYVGNQAY